MTRGLSVRCFGSSAFWMAVALALCISPGAVAQLAVTPNAQANVLANALFGPCGIEWLSATGNFPSNSFGTSAGTFTVGTSPNTYGLALAGAPGGGIVLSTGDVADYGTGASTQNDHSFQFNTGGTAAEKALMQPLTGTTALRDVAHLTVTLNVTTPHAVSFAYVFGTEEYSEWVGSEFIDAFGIFVDGVNIALPSGQPSNVNNPCMTGLAGTELDGVIVCNGSAVNVTTALLSVGVHTIDFIIADASDPIFDSTAYIRCFCDWADPPVFTLQPTSVTVPCGSSLTETVQATADCGVFYTWEILPCPGTGGNWISLSDTPNVVTGTQTATITFFNAGVDLYQGCTIRAIAHSPGGSTYSDPFVITRATPTISQQPVSATGCPPQPMTFHVASPNAGVSYQWFKQCGSNPPVAIPGATSATLDNNAPAFWMPGSDDCGCDVFCRVSHPTCGVSWSDHARIECCDCMMPPTNMALWLSFDELSGGTCQNLVSPWNGVCYPLGSGAVPWAGFWSSNSRFLDGINDVIVVRNHSLIEFTSPGFTIDLWVYIEGSCQNECTLVSKYDPLHSSAGYSLGICGGQLCFTLADTAPTTWIATSAAGTIPSGVWTHVAVTIDRASATGGRLYVNGATALTFDPTVVPGSLSNDMSMLIGSDHHGASYFLGGVDELEVFRRALTPDEIATLYSAGGVGKCKQYCQVAQPVNFCAGATSRVVGARFYNLTPNAVTVTPVFSWITPGVPCFAGPFVPTDAIGPSAPASVSAFSSTTSVAVAPRPAALPAGGTACFDSVMALSSGRVVECSGMVQDRPDLPCSGNCLACATAIAVGEMTLLNVDLPVSSNAGGVLPYQVYTVAMNGAPSGALAIGGMPPGKPLYGSVKARPGGTALLQILLEWQDIDALGATGVVFSTDEDGDGNYEPVAIQWIDCVVPRPTADLNADGLVDGTDLGILLGAWGSTGDTIADISINGIVDGEDLGVLLGQWSR